MTSFYRIDQKNTGLYIQNRIYPITEAYFRLNYPVLTTLCLARILNVDRCPMPISCGHWSDTD